MKKRNVVILAFLLVLYIVPTNLMLSSYSSTIPTEQNTAKDFSVSSGAWYNDGWNYRKPVIINAGEFGTPTYYQVQIPVTYDSDMQADFDDIRFTDWDGVTLLDFWLESKTDSTSAVFWVEVIDDLGFFVPVTIYMYYGNDIVSSASNGTATFLFFDDFSTLDADKWSWSGAEVIDGELQLTASEWIKSDLTFNSSTALETRSKQALGSRHNLGFASDWPAIGAMWIQHNSDGNAYMYEGNTDTGTLLYPDGTYCIQSLYWKDADEGAYDIDRAGIQHRDDADIPDSDMYLGIQLWGSATTTYYADWIFLRQWVEVEPYVDSFGEEEEYTPTYGESWQEVGEAELIFSVPIDETALNWFLILLGMFMVPASTLYLVKGGKKDASMDKAFYSIVVFLIGWGLIFIGVS